MLIRSSLLLFKRLIIQVPRYYSTRLQLSKLSEIERVETLRQMALPKSRPNPIIFKLDTPEFQSIFTEELKSLSSLFGKYGYDIRIAGGAVRDLLMGFKPKDLDFATTATPGQMKDMFAAENVRMINMNGEKHGTITPRINDKENFEVTTLRIDVVCDGRHAEIQFTTDWMLDALRRDLTINSMFLGLDGSVYDFFYGYDDLKEHKVKFVGDAETRIQEDYLRILRYFRFYGRISKEAEKHDPATLEAIIDNSNGLENISGERIWMELKKILEGNYAGNLLLKIVDCGLAPYIGIVNANTSELKKVWQRSESAKLHPITLLASLLNSTDEAVALNARLKLSAYERDLAIFVVENRSMIPHEKPLLPYQQMCVTTKGKASDVFEFVVEVLKYNNSKYLEEFQKWTIPKFPITGFMLKEKGVESGRFMGVVMSELKNLWADGEFALAPEELLQELPKVLSVLKERRKR